MEGMVSIKNQLFVRVLGALFLSFLISLGIWGAFTFAADMIAVTREEKVRESERAELNAAIDEARKEIAERSYTFQNVKSNKLFENLDDYEVYLAGTDGKIYEGENAQGTVFESADVSVQGLYVFALEYSDGYGYVLIKPQETAGIKGNYKLFIVIGSLLLFTLLSYHLVRKQTGKAESLTGWIEKPDRAELPEEGISGKTIQSEREYTDLYTLLLQYIGEKEEGILFRGDKGPVYIYNDIYTFVEVLECIIDKIISLKKDNSKITLWLDALEDRADLKFRTEVRADSRQTDLDFTEEQYRYIMERMKPVNGTIKAMADKEEFEVSLAFSR